MIRLPKKFKCQNSLGEDGVTAIEFAFVMPVFLMLLLGTFDFTYNLYVRTVLQGSVDEAGRKGSLEKSTTAEIDAFVLNRISSINNKNTIIQTRTFYQNYNEIARAEDYTETNNNTICDAGETFIDRNGSGVWDIYYGLNGRGGAQDVVVYRVSLKYNRMFPIWSMIGQPRQQEIVATTVLRNQPFNAQTAQLRVPRICP